MIIHIYLRSHTQLLLVYPWSSEYCWSKLHGWALNYHTPQLDLQHHSEILFSVTLFCSNILISNVLLFTPPTLSFLAECLISFFIQKIENREWKLHLPITKSKNWSSFAPISAMFPAVTVEVRFSTVALKTIHWLSITFSNMHSFSDILIFLSFLDYSNAYINLSHNFLS